MPAIGRQISSRWYRTVWGCGSILASCMTERFRTFTGPLPGLEAYRPSSVHVNELTLRAVQAPNRVATNPNSCPEPMQCFADGWRCWSTLAAGCRRLLAAQAVEAIKISCANNLLRFWTISLSRFFA